MAATWRNGEIGRQCEFIGEREGLTVELVEPAADAVEGGAAGDVVDDEGADGSAVVGGGDGAEALLAGCVPDLGLHLLALDFDDLSLELDADGGLGVEVELVTGEPGEKVRLADGRVPDHHYLEEVLLFPSFLILISSPHG